MSVLINVQILCWLSFKLLHAYLVSTSLHISILVSNIPKLIQKTKSKLYRVWFGLVFKSRPISSRSCTPYQDMIKIEYN